MRRSLGLEIGAAALRWVELAEERGGITVRDSGVAPLTGSGEAAVADALRALAAARRLRGREVVVSVPRAAVTLRWLSLPAATRDETAGMVELEAGQSLPFPVEDAALDFVAFPDGDGRQAVLLAGARRALIQERRRALEAAGLRAGAIAVDALAVAAAARAAVPDQAQGVLLIHQEGDTATFSWAQGARLCLSRAVTPGPADAEAMATEVRRILLAGGMAGGATPEVGAVWLTGEGAGEEAARALAGALAAETTGQVRVELLPRCPFAGTEALAPELDTALGLALLGLRPAAERLDLARQVRPVTPSGASAGRRRVPLLVGLGAAVVAAAFLLPPGGGDRELAAARARSDARQFAARRRQMEERVRLLHGAVVPAHSYLDVLNDVSALAGPDVWLTHFTYDRGRPLVIRGAARSRAAVARLVEGLRNSQHLERVLLGAVTQSAEEGQNTVQFTVTGVLRGDAPLQARRRGSSRRTREGA